MANEKEALNKWMRYDQAELRIWRKNHPRTASEVRQLAEAEVDGRKPPEFKPREYA